MPIYRNKETGHEVEVMRGTRLPKVYEEVNKRTTVKNIRDDSNNDKTVKKSAPKAKRKAKTSEVKDSKSDGAMVKDDTTSGTNEVKQ